MSFGFRTLRTDLGSRSACNACVHAAVLVLSRRACWQGLGVRPSPLAGPQGRVNVVAMDVKFTKKEFVSKFGRMRHQVPSLKQVADMIEIIVGDEEDFDTRARTIVKVFFRWPAMMARLAQQLAAVRRSESRTRRRFLSKQRYQNKKRRQALALAQRLAAAPKAGARSWGQRRLKEGGPFILD